jgi:hypothetical protein
MKHKMSAASWTILTAYTATPSSLWRLKIVTSPSWIKISVLHKTAPWVIVVRKAAQGWPRNPGAPEGSSEK